MRTRSETSSVFDNKYVAQSRSPDDHTWPKIANEEGVRTEHPSLTEPNGVQTSNLWDVLVPQ
ncbi:MAG: hypothetical protein KTR25_11735 [Myxococcales bacterium]|nr:hypothetical protein [Myxococcales bacterium]